VLITRCWAEKPEDRLRFSDIIMALERIHFAILPGVDRKAVQAFVLEVRSEARLAAAE
jgi:hypothetical protein